MYVAFTQPCSDSVFLLTIFFTSWFLCFNCVDFMGSHLTGNKDIRKAMVERSVVVILYHSLLCVCTMMSSELIMYTLFASLATSFSP